MSVLNSDNASKLDGLFTLPMLRKCREVGDAQESASSYFDVVHEFVARSAVRAGECHGLADVADGRRLETVHGDLDCGVKGGSRCLASAMEKERSRLPRGKC